ncbi:MAG TPA: ATP-binding protein [Polyangiaceae bacterium]|nr:ATP-binding protein [Polyangiaceae bacterium]
MSPRALSLARSVQGLTWDDCRLLVESVVDYAIFMLDTEGRVATWNIGAERIKGYSASEVIGKHISTFYPPEEVAARKPWRELELALELGRVEDEGWRVRKDGSRFWANVVITALRDSAGNLRGFGKVTRDLTARMRAEDLARKLVREQAARAAAEEAEARVREGEERYRSLSRRLEVIIEGVGDAITVQDARGELLFANTAAARLCGFARSEELLRTPFAEIIARFEMRDELGNPVDEKALPGSRVLAGEAPEDLLVHVREKSSGKTWWSLVRASPVLGSDGRVELVVNILRDVTEGRRLRQHEKLVADATAALSASLDYEQTLTTLARMLVPAFGDWCVVHVLEGGELRDVSVAHVDPEKVAMARALQQKYSPDPTQDHGIWSVLRTGQSELHADLSLSMLAEKIRDPERLAILEKLGLTSMMIAPIRVRDTILGTLSIVAAESKRRYDERDLRLLEELGRRAGHAIEQARLYRSAQESAERALEAGRVKDEFLATVSHELRTPLNAILGWATLLQGRSVDAGIAKGIDVIYRNAQAQAKIIEDILDVSRIITGKLKLESKPADLVAIARDAMDVVRPSAQAKRIELELDARGEFCPLVADPERLQQVVWNLLSNAVKFTGPNGRVRVEIRQERSNVVLRVSDTGAGIDPSFLPHVFDRFKQADSSTTRRVGGLGLGLALVRHIVELHGGDVSAESEGPGKGATFIVRLPVRALLPRVAVEPTAPSSLPPSERRQRASLNGLRLLVVDDDPDARELLKMVLTHAGAEVETAGSASEGLLALQRFRPHVLVSDIGMPEEDGYSFITRARALAPSQGGGIPSIALTAYTRAEDRTKALAAGFTTHVGKPVNPDDLISAVANLSAFVRR